MSVLKAFIFQLVSKQFHVPGNVFPKSYHPRLYVVPQNARGKLFRLPSLIITMNDFKGFTIFNRFTSDIKKGGDHVAKANMSTHCGKTKLSECDMVRMFRVVRLRKTSQQKIYDRKRTIMCHIELKSILTSLPLSLPDETSSALRIQINLFHNAYHKSLLNNMLKPKRQS